MNVTEIRNWLITSDFCKNHKEVEYKPAVILLVCKSYDTVCPDRIKEITGYSSMVINKTLFNIYKSRIIIDGRFCTEWGMGDDFLKFLSFTADALSASGTIQRAINHKVYSIYPLFRRKIKFRTNKGDVWGLPIDLIGCLITVVIDSSFDGKPQGSEVKIHSDTICQIRGLMKDEVIDIKKRIVEQSKKMSMPAKVVSKSLFKRPDIMYANNDVKI